MTLVVILAIGTLVGIGLYCYATYSDNDLLLFISIFLIIVSLISCLTSLIIWIPSKKNSELEYQQMIVQHDTLVDILKSDDKLDVITVQELVYQYNNDVIFCKNNSKRFILKDYYSNDVDWDDLEIVEWRKNK